MRKMATVAFLAGLCAGCANNFSQPVAPEAPRTVAQRNFDAVWNASLSVLRDYRFTVAVEDRREGTISTGPLVGQQWFEFWRKDAVTPTSAIEGSVQTIYKTATVTIRPEPNDPDRFVASVKVALARSDKPTRSVTDTSEAYGLFTLTGSGNRWLSNFGRTAEEEAEETVTGRDRRRAGAAAERLRQISETPTTQKAADWRVPIGTDETLARRLASEIAAAAARKMAKK